MTDRLMNINPADLKKIVEHEDKIRERLDHPYADLQDYYGKIVVGSLGLGLWIKFPNGTLTGTVAYERKFIDDTIVEYAKKELGIKLEKK